MLKKLRRSGNSHALVLDQTLLSMLGIGPDHLVQLTPYRDHMILGRPHVVAPLPPPKSAVEVPELVAKLDTHGLGPSEFARLSHDGTRLLVFVGQAEAGLLVDQVTVARLRRCHERVVTLKESIDQAIEAVLAEFPGTRTSDSEA